MFVNMGFHQFIQQLEFIHVMKIDGSSAHIRPIRNERGEPTHRSETGQVQKRKYNVMANADQSIVDRVAELAEKHGVPRAQIAKRVPFVKQIFSA